MPKSLTIIALALSAGGMSSLAWAEHRAWSRSSSAVRQIEAKLLSPTATQRNSVDPESSARSAECAPGIFPGRPSPPVTVVTPRPGEDGWDERYQGQELDLAGTSLAYCEDFRRNLNLNGPVLWAKQHADVGLAKFDGPGGNAYGFREGTLELKAYKSNGEYRGANVQSTNADQAYQGARIEPGTRGYTCTGCYWEARVRFPRAYGGWGAFWLLTPDNPRDRGHLEVDVIEYYGLADRRGHHHALHRWRRGVSQTRTDYTGMDDIADFEWHTYGVDLRGISQLDNKPALVIYMDGKEVGRIAPESDFFSKPFYYLFSMTLNPRETQHTVPQALQVDHVRVYRPSP